MIAFRYTGLKLPTRDPVWISTAANVIAARGQRHGVRLWPRSRRKPIENVWARCGRKRHPASGATLDQVPQPFDTPADWRILKQSHRHTKKDAHTAVFSLDVPRDDEVVLTYRVRVTY